MKTLKHKNVCGVSRGLLFGLKYKSKVLGNPGRSERCLIVIDFLHEGMKTLKHKNVCGVSRGLLFGLKYKSKVLGNPGRSERCLIVIDFFA